MAILLSSAGPCYYGAVVGGPDPYAPLMEYLQRVDAIRPLTALDVQAMLWSGFVGSKVLIGGISAMPSIHVALPALFGLATWRVSRLASGARWGSTAPSSSSARCIWAGTTPWTATRRFSSFP